MGNDQTDSSIIDDITNAYEKISSTANDNAYTWTKGGGLNYKVKKSFDMAYDYIDIFQNKYNIYKDTVDKMGYDNYTSIVLQDFAALGVELTNEQIHHIETNIDKGEEMIQLLKSILVDAGDFKKTSSLAGTELNKFDENSRKLDNELINFDLIVLKKEDELNTVIADNSLKIDQMWDELKRKCNLYTESYEEEVRQRALEQEKKNLANLRNSIIATVGLTAFFQFVPPMVFKALQVTSPTVKFVTTTTAAKVSTAKKIAEIKYHKLIPTIGKATLDKIKLAYGQVLTAAQKKYIAVKTIAIVTTSAIAVDLLTEMMEQLDISREMQEIQDDLKEILKEERQLDFYKSSLNFTKRIMKFIKKHKKSYDMASPSISTVIDGISGQTKSYEFLINDINVILQKAGKITDKTEKESFLQNQIEKTKCFWEKTHQDLGKFSDYIGS